MINDWPEMKAFALSLGLPKVEETTSWGNEVLKAHGKLWVWWSPYVEAAPFKCDKDERDMLRAAVKGDAVAQFMVATRFSDGKAVPKDFDKAASWYHKAATKGLAPAQYRLGTFYERGRGVKKDIKTAKSWYEHAAHRGHIKAMHNLAVLLANGSDGAP